MGCLLGIPGQVEQMVHRKLALFNHELEFFRVSESVAVDAIEEAIDLFGIIPVQFDVLNPPNRKYGSGQERKKPAPTWSAGFSNFTFRFDDTLRRKAERLAKADKRSLGVWLSLIVEEKIAEIEATAPSRKPRAR